MLTMCPHTLVINPPLKNANTYHFLPLYEKRYKRSLLQELQLRESWMVKQFRNDCTPFLFVANVDIRSQIGGRATRHQYEERVSRKHFVTRQDLRNITRAVRSYSHHRHCEDAISVDRIVAELSQENPASVIAYKCQGSPHPEYPTLQDDTFLLVIMTSYQSQLFEEFAYKVVCMDSTHKTNEYRFKLITLLVVVGFHKGRLMH